MKRFLILLFLFGTQELFGLRNGKERAGDNIVPDYDDNYYYINTRDKMIESLSVSNCTMANLDLRDEAYGDNSDKFSELQLVIVPPPIGVQAKWGTIGFEKYRNPNIYFRVSENLCSDKLFEDFTKGKFKRSKGCLKMSVPDGNGILRKRINRYAATLHPEHIRCDTQQVIDSCNNASQAPVPLSNKYRSYHNYPFIVKAKDVIVTRSGMISLPCGAFGLFASCEAVKYGVPMANNITELGHTDICRKNPRNCPYPIHNKIFVATQYDDTQIGQFIMETLPKIVYNLEYLYANPDVKIHFGFTKQPTIPNWVVPLTYFHWLGLGNRLINGTFYAHEVVIPREGGCQDVSYNAWEALNQREVFLGIAGVKSQDDLTLREKSNLPKSVQKRSILIVCRAASKFTQNQHDHNRRRWPQDVLNYMKKTLAQQFPRHDIDIYTDADTKLMQNPGEQVVKFHRADIVLGIHGAGLTNALYMKPGSVLVEALPYFDSRHVPIVGIFARLANIVGLHHYSYFFGEENINGTHLVEEVIKFSRQVAPHI